MRRIIKVWYISFGILLIIPILSFQSVNAEDIGPTQVQSIFQKDINGDGHPDLTVIDFSFVSGYTHYRPRYPGDAIWGSGRVSVYDQNRDMPVSSDWEKATDFNDDVWVFDYGRTGNAQLIIVFKVEGGRQVAHLYDDWDGDGKVAYTISGTEVNILEAGGRWTAKVSSESTWRLANGRLNYNLTILIDGCIDTTRGNRIARGFRNCEDRVDGDKPDGKPDWMIEIADREKDGAPDSILGRIVSPNVNPVDYEGSSTLYVNSGHHVSKEYPEQIFWPFLITENRTEIYNFFDYQPAVLMNWSRAQFYVGTIGYPIESGYFINSTGLWKKNELNYANFENPMAYYDLANNQDGNSELFIRMVTYRANDPYPRLLRLSKPFIEAEEDWNISGTKRNWDYKFGLWSTLSLGTVTFPDFSLYSIPYDNLPDWVNQNKWDLGIFIVREREKYISTEGIGLWDASTGYLSGKYIASPLPRYLAGGMDSPPVGYYSDIDVGMRGEINFQYNSRPTMYLSPIDNRLHMVNAEYGVWKTATGDSIIEKNLDRGDLINGWIKIHVPLCLSCSEMSMGGHKPVSEALYSPPNFLVYSGPTGVSMLKILVSPSLFKITPPTDQASWLEFKAKVEPYTSQKRDPSNLKSWLDAFSGESYVISKASIQDFNINQTGFNFILALEPGFKTEGTFGLDLSNLSPGYYQINYSGSFAIQPLQSVKPGNITISVTLADANPRAFAGNTIEAVLQNAGVEDMDSVWVQAYIARPGGEPRLLLEKNISLPAQETVKLNLPWSPTSSGRQLLMLVVGETYDTLLTSPEGSASLEVNVGASSTIGFSAIWSLSNVSRPAALLALLLCLGLASALSAMVFIRESNP